MIRFTRIFVLAACATLSLCVAADGQYITYYAPTTVTYPTTTYYAPAPTTVYYSPTPTTTYYAPAPTTVYYSAAPATTYVAPAPTTVYYSAPAVTSFYRPLVGRGITRVGYYTPAVAYPPSTTYQAYYPWW